MEAIESAISSLGRSQFRDQFWDRAVAFVPGGAKRAEEVRELLDQISCFLDRTDIRYPSLRLVKDGKEIPLEDYTRELRLGPHLSHDWIVNELVFHHYQRGATIILQMLQNSLPSFGNIANRMEQYFGANIHVSCFITPPDAQGFTAHYDTYSFFAVQLFGTKKWSLYNATEQLPIRDDREYEDTWNQVAPEREITLHAGDVMYVPRGRYHSAVTSSSASVHLTVGIFSPNWIDATRAAVTDLQSLPQLRQSITDRGDHEDDVMESVAADELLRSRIDLRAGARKLMDQVFAKHIDSRSGRLHDLLLLSDNHQLRTFKRQSVPHKIAIRGDQCILQFANKELRFPKFIYQLLVVISERQASFQVLDLPNTLDQESMQVLLRRLVAEGFLQAMREKN